MIASPKFCSYEKSEQLRLYFEIWLLTQTNIRFLPFCCFAQLCDLIQSSGVAADMTSAGNNCSGKVQIFSQASEFPHVIC